MNCVECEVKMVSKSVWARMSPAAREREGVKPHEGFGLCRADHARQRRIALARGLEPKPVVDPRCVNPDCQIETVPSRTWFAMSEDEREGKMRVGGRGLCRHCYDRPSVRERFALEPSRSYHRLEEVLEDWVMIKDSVHGDIREAAPRMGMTWKALEKALCRARKLGDERGHVPPRYLLGRSA